MRTAVMTCDFLLAPAYCDPEEIDGRVAELAEYARAIQVHDESPLLEEDAVGKLHESGSYPCDSLFKSNLGKLEEQFYTVKDISRLVTGILANAKYFEYAEKRLWESNSSTLNPPFAGLNVERKAQIHKLVEDVAVCNELEQVNYSVLHFCTQNLFPGTEVSVELASVYPAIAEKLPYSFSRMVELYSSYRNYLTSICLQQSLQADPENIDLMKECFYWGGLCDLKKRGLSLNNFASNAFEIGPTFIESLKMNQSLPGQKFWNSCFSSVVAVLTGDDTYEVNIFRKSAKSDEQRTSGDFKAYRCHVTKSGVALRLMFWRNDDDLIILANVGPKNEEKIEDPAC